MFFARELQKLKPGKILLPAEGEGRNAVFAAKLGWEVCAFDFSITAKEKALKLAQCNNVVIDYKTASFDDFSGDVNSFDCIALIFAHFPNDQQPEYHKKLLQFLKPDGVIILEAFSTEQINNNTGGPKSIKFLFSPSDLESDFSRLETSKIEIIQLDLKEEELHNGKSDLIRLVGNK